MDLDPLADGTSNTFMHAEIWLPDGEHVLTAVQHSAKVEDSRGLWQINVEANQYSSLTYAGLSDGPAVAIETITIAHEGLSLF